MNKFIDEVYQLIEFTLNQEQVKQFETYERLLLEWNQRFNLTAIRDAEGIRRKHFLDALTCLKVLPWKEAFTLVDVGSGAGFPGIPLKIACPLIELTLIEATQKKARFCELVLQELGLSSSKVVALRVEEAARRPDHRQAYDWAVARAVAPLPVLAEYLLPLLKTGGRAIAMKGAGALEESRQAQHAIQLLGGQLKEIVPLQIPGIEELRYLVLINKIALTPPGYPRRPGMAEKIPL